MFGRVKGRPTGSGLLCQEEGPVRQTHCRVRHDQAEDCRNGHTDLHPGGYGYIHDYGIERGYRDSRINRIWEGTNEINRLLIVDMLTKRAMKNRLPVLVAAQKGANELLTLRPKVETDDGKLTLQKDMVEMSKKIGTLVAGAAVQKYMMKLGG